MGPIVLEGVEAPDKSTPEGQKAKEKLAELVLKKKVEYETLLFQFFLLFVSHILLG